MNRHTTSSGMPIGSDARDGILETHLLNEKLAHFNREKIPERITHAKGAGAYGVFTVTADITSYTKARIFSEVGKHTPVFVRFSNYRGEKGTADTVRDPRGFAIKFYTEEGNWDFAGNNIPIFYIRDARKLPDLIHSQKRDPQTNLNIATSMWDFWSLSPETLHGVVMNFSERGIPKSYRYMDGFSCHAFSFINAKNEKVWVKFHFKSEQGNKSLSSEEAIRIAGENPDYYTEDLFQSIESGIFPKWKLFIQVLTDKDLEKFTFDPFDVTKVWPHSIAPEKEVGILELNRNPENYFAEVEQAAFSPANIVPGIGFSPDKLLQARIFAYPDAQRHRLGVNYQTIPINRPRSYVENGYRDGMMRIDSNGGSHVNYSPNSLEEMNERTLQPSANGNDSLAFNKTYPLDEYTQAGNLYRLMTDEKKEILIENLVESMRHIPTRIQIRQCVHFYKADTELAYSVVDSLGLDFNEIKMLSTFTYEELIAETAKALYEKIERAKTTAK
ncbi:MAG TPA: catalase [Leptospiraceae bacterium]|nr:catalase [Leptospiraceae bacterium]HMW07347.1 catalase [Leptospiraceae bacterium]HMX33379.1 catalase [Leptospiraceae bacterium]HMY32945.1 catalase [Leptospiraceae bacterium]HMZ64559.1 catalase [Leptospiraceae bacterium]